MRLKDDHSGYRSHGLWQKYQYPKIDEERFTKPRTKKDGSLCVDKKEHKWHRFQCKGWENDITDDTDTHEHIKCFACGKKKSPKTAKNLNLPLHVWIKNDKGGYDVVQVKVNGEYPPIPREAFHKNKYWCDTCRYWH